jgi:hypothetical protein
MAINVPIRDPAANGSPLGSTLVAQVVGTYKGTLTVQFVLTDEGNGSKSDPIPTNPAGGNIYNAPRGNFPVPGRVYTVTAVAKLVDPANGSVVDTGSSARTGCRC